MDTLNHAPSQIMHIDLNSCFAIVEQQANPLIRHKPVVVAAYDTSGGMILASSYEAKRLGIKLGLSVEQGRHICPGLVALMPDAPKYREAHKRLRKVLIDYTDAVNPRSIDEFVLDMAGSPAVRQGRDLREVGYEIKERVKESLGEYMTVNVGIGPNRFIAKTAAGWHKPDGLDMITTDNLHDLYKDIELTDLPGINIRYEARLKAAGINTPTQFLEASGDYLRRWVFRSKLGPDWAMRLRGWEVDGIEWGRKSFGNQYALSHKTSDIAELEKLLMKLAEKTGRRLRRNFYTASGVSLSLAFEDHRHWRLGRRSTESLWATQDIFNHAQKLLNQAPLFSRVRGISITVYALHPTDPEQLGLFDDSRLDHKPLAKAADIVNDRYGEFTLVPALMAGMDGTILDRIAFGRTDQP